VSLGLRRLLAKIQKEFHYPKVFAVKTKLPVKVHPFRDRPEIQIRTIEKPQVPTHQIQLRFEQKPVQARIETPNLHQVQRMEDMQTEAHPVTCWRKHDFAVHRFLMIDPDTESQTLEFEPIQFNKRRLRFRMPPKRVKKVKLLGHLVLRRSLPLAKQMPRVLHVTPMDRLPKRLLIRYRSGALRALKLSPKDVSFLGICMGLPAVPLSLLRYQPEKGLEPAYALAMQTGPANTQQIGRRIWVMLHIKSRDRILPITIKEELD
jgi:hypothetical protein